MHHPPSPSPTPSPSWYAVPQPYSVHSPSQLPPLLPGAPDFPPSPSSMSPVQVAAGSETLSRLCDGNAVQQSPNGWQSAGKRDYTGNRVQHLPTANGVNTNWRPGHSPHHSQPALPTYIQQSANNLSSPWSKPSLMAGPDSEHSSPVRPVSPRPQLNQAFFDPPQNSTPVTQHTQHAELHDPPLHAHPPPPRVHSSQPRRNTLPSPITEPQPSSNGSPSRTAGSVSGRRPLPTVPVHPSTSIPPQRAATAPQGDISPVLSRSSSSASTVSTTSMTSNGSMRRPLPKPPSLPSIFDVTSPGEANHSPISKPPASFASARAHVRNQHWTGKGVEDVSLDLNTMTKGSPHPSSSVPSIAVDADQNPTSNVPSIAVDTNQTPTKQRPNEPPPIPSFSFDEVSDEPNGSSTSAPTISISVAPPSPRISTATSDDYFEPIQETDEKVPLPVSSVPMATRTKAYAIACPGCTKPVLYGRTCSTKLEHLEFFSKDGRPYCHVDYHELFSIRCAHCQTPIVDETYITIDDVHLGGKKTYHELHFFCANCGDPFVDPKAQNDSSDDGAVYSENQAKPFTETDTRRCPARTQ
ncbi:hypothetical protein EMMF5_003958 [Cystobasidiomycetes sp. EMM_F5]